jgi:uncharacterized membrane protein YbhN (UPF0104 family)
MPLDPGGTGPLAGPAGAGQIIRWLGTLIAVALLVYILKEQNWEDFWKALQKVPAGYFVLCVGLTLLSRLSITGRWYTLLRSAGVPVTAGQSLRLTFAGLLANNFLFTTIGGDVVRFGGAVQMRLESAPVAASLVMDRVIGSLGMATLLPIGLPRVLTALAALALSGVGMAPFAQHPHGGLRVASLVVPVWVRKLWFRGLGFIQSLLRTFLVWARRPLGLLGALGWTYCHMAFTFTTLWLLLKGMGEPVSWWLIGGLWVLSYFVTLLPISMNGLGVQELSITYLFSHFAGVSPEASATLAILMRLLPFLTSLPGILFLPGMLRRSPKGVSPGASE